MAKEQGSTKDDRLLLIDGDIILYSTLSATEMETEVEPEVWSITNDLKEFKRSVKTQLKDIQKRLKGRLVVCLSSPSNFRKEIDADYKGNRKNVRKPVGFKAARQWMLDEYKAVMMEGLEADDVMGILSTKPTNIDAVIVSTDKDMKGIPGKLYRFRTDEKIVVSEEEADLWWLTQTLTGDPTDNYPGCPGVGAVKAKAILERPGDRWENVKGAFIGAGLTEEDAIKQARLARILRWSDWDGEARRPILWRPKATEADRTVQLGTGERKDDGGDVPI